MIKTRLKPFSLAALALTLSACNNYHTGHSGYYQQQGYNHNGYAQQRAPNPYYGNGYGPQRPHAARNRRGINVNYETLNALEAPLAFQVADVTMELRGRIDTPLSYSFDTDEFSSRKVIGNHQVRAETQLPNRITVGAVYGGQYENLSGRNNDYNDNVAAFAGGSWGTVFGGNVSDIVREDTRRLRGVTPVRLAGDGPLGGLGEWSGGYQGRYGPTIITAAMDEDKNYDVGISVQRPIGTKDYRFTARHNNGQYVAADGLTELETKSVSAVGEYIYGSSRFDLGGGYERIEDADRWFTSAGVTSKHGVWSVSAEGHYGKIEGQDEMSAVIGLRRDIARGLAATMAFDYQDRQINVNGVDYINENDKRVVMGLSYGF